MLSQILKWIGIVSGIAVGLIILGIIGILIFFRMVFGPSYNKQDLIRNYEQKSKEISLVRDFFIAIAPANAEIRIEFDENSDLEIFHVLQDGYQSNNWNLKAHSTKVDSLLKVLSWNQQTLTTLKMHLDQADCISVESGEPLTVGYKRSGLGMYFYKLFKAPLTDSLKGRYNDRCAYSVYQEKVVLEYSGGAVGPNCFEDYSGK